MRLHRAPGLGAAFLALPAVLLAGHNVWTNAGPEDPVIQSLAIDPRSNMNLLAGTERGFVFRSGDGGATWAEILDAGALNTIPALLIDPDDSQTYYAGTYRYEGTGPGRLLRSTDGGRDWTPASDGLPPSRGVWALASQGHDLYVGVDAGLYKSSDHGSHWFASFTTEGIGAIGVSPTSPKVVIGSSYGVYYSEDAGKTWSSSNLRKPVRQIAIHPQNPAIVNAVAGDPAELYRSVDGGATWLPFAFSDAWSVAYDSASPANFYILGDTLFRETSSGFEVVATDMVTTFGREKKPLVADPRDPTVFYAFGFGLLKSSNACVVWSETTAGMLDDLWASCVAIDPSNPSTIYVGGWDWPEIHRRRDADAWDGLYSDVLFGVSALAVDPTESNRILAAGENMQLSEDGGRTWKDTGFIPLGSYVSILYDASHPATVYASSDGLVMRSDDHGETWAISTPPYPSVGGPLAIAQTTPPLVYAATFQGVYRSIVGSDAWYPLAAVPGTESPGNVLLRAIAVDPQHPSTLYVGAGDGKLWKSDDGGSHWTASHPAGTSVASIAIDPADSSTVFAATDSGVSRSDDGGQSWNDWNEGLGGRGVNQLLIAPNGRSFYAVTDSGVYERSQCGSRTSRDIPVCQGPITLSPR